MEKSAKGGTHCRKWKNDGKFGKIASFDENKYLDLQNNFQNFSFT